MKNMKTISPIMISIIMICTPASAQWVKISAPDLYIDFFYTWQDYLYAGTDGHGVYVSENDGDSWTQLGNGMSAGSVTDLLAVEQNGAMLLFAALSDSGVYISADSGNTWGASNTGLINLNACALICKNDTVFVGTYKGVHRSVDFGQHWSPCSTGMDDRSVDGLTKLDAYLFASSTSIAKGGIFRSRDGGNTWQEKNYCPEGNIYLSSIGARDLELLDSRIYANSGTILLTSDDIADSWQNSSSGLIPGMYITDLAGYGDYMFLSQHPSVYMRHKDSTRWQDISANLGGGGFKMMNCLTVYNDYLYLAGNFNNVQAIYRRPLSELITAFPQPDDFTVANFRLEQNSPNPFNPKTVIRYELPVNCNVDLSIYNLLGQKVATLVNEKQPAGKYSVNWNTALASGGQGFASGVYLYILCTSDGLIQSKKLVLLK